MHHVTLSQRLASSHDLSRNLVLTRRRDTETRERNAYVHPRKWAETDEVKRMGWCNKNYG
jgi:hypothetical protein